MSGAENRVVVSHSGSVLTITLNRPEQLNPVDEAMLASVADAVEEPGDANVIVLRGAGRGFSSGADLGADLGAAGELQDAVGAGTIDEANRLVRALTTSAVPSVAIVQGPCAGIGVSLALATDIVIASEEAFFQLAFSRIGLMPDGGATALVAASVGRTRAVRMALLAERITATQALDWGLVASVVPGAELEAAATDVIERLARGPRAALATTTRAINAATLDGLEGALDRERAGQLKLLAAGDFREGVLAFAEKRQPTFSDPAV